MKISVNCISRESLREQVDDLRLDGNVERGDRFVGDDELGFDGERAGDGDALALAAGKFVRIFFQEPRRQADLFHQLARLARGVPPLRHLLRAPGRFRERIEDRHPRIKRGVRVLKNHLKIRARVAQFGAVEMREVFSRENDSAVGRRNQLQDGAAERGFAAAGFADESENFALAQVER